jgi:serine/threonine protein kinase
VSSNYRILLEFVRKGTLTTYMKRYNPKKPMAIEKKFTILHQLADALLAVENAGMIHTDAKSDNILVFDTKIPKISARRYDYRPLAEMCRY